MFSAKRLANPVVFIGTGVIAFELGHVLVRAGSRVTMLGGRPLAGFEADLVAHCGIGLSPDGGIHLLPPAPPRVEAGDGPPHGSPQH